MENLYTWKDIEIELEKSRKKWPDSWIKIDVYCDEIVIVKNKIQQGLDEDKVFLQGLLKNYYLKEEHAVYIKEFDVKLPIVYEENDFGYERHEIETLPLFRSIYYNEIKVPYEKKLPGKPVIAFHSYKGGVGRTLTLIALWKEISNLYGNNKKVLVIDSDLEAPGLTWIIERSSEASFSFMDFLDVLRVYGGERLILEKAAELMSENVVYLETEKERVEHYFLPVSNKESQLAEMYGKPESFLGVADNKFLISESVSVLGQLLGVDLVLVDLRAGLSEISAPFLFDPRVDKYFVSSTSLQSIRGTRNIQKQVYEKSKLGLMNSKILLTMIPPQFNDEWKAYEIDSLVEIPEEIYDQKDETFLRDEYVIELDFESQLLYQGEFEQICQSLTGTKISKKMNAIAKGIFAETEGDKEQEQETVLEEEKVKKCLRRLNEKADVTAEASDASDMLLTDSIQAMIRTGKKEILNIVVLGAKGSGKTYLYKQLVTQKNWKTFTKVFGREKEENPANDAVFIPVLSTANSKKINSAIRDCLDNVIEYMEEPVIDKNILKDIEKNIQKGLKEEKTSEEWEELWEKQLLAVFSNRFETLEQLNNYLFEQHKNVIFLFDGLDDLMNCGPKEQEYARTAVQALCQRIVRKLDWFNNRSIGMMVFVRRDIAEDSIRVNFQQFRDQYSKYELTWSQKEALRLALWISGRAIPELQMKENENILLLSREEIEKRLELLWGRKLGKKESKEANAARWVLAALSDFNGQLQARDIVRFLKNASGEPSKMDFKDRYIMPNKIRGAIEPCAKDKLKEIQDEMPSIYDILKKFDIKESSDKVLPLELDKISLSMGELEKLQQQGFIKVSEKRYYLPEIIRQALGFKYKKGARPKVLSMIIQ